MRGRPRLLVSYEADSAPLNSSLKRTTLTVGVALLIWLPVQLNSELQALLATAFFAAIGAIGLNIVTGLAGQISLGHAFFLGLGAYTGVVLASDPDGELLGLGLDMVIWLPGAGIVAALAGLLIALVAARLRGLYLAFVTLGLVFLGEHIFRSATEITGGAGVGRPAPDLVFLGIDLETPTTILGYELDRTTKLYFIGLILLAGFAIAAKNLARSGVGRALAAVRDHEMAAEMIGVTSTRYKLIAFAVSSFYAGVAGVMLATVSGYIEPGTYTLFLSIEFIAMIVIGGIGTLAGALMGAAFVTVLPRLIEELARVVPVISASAQGPFPNVFELQAIAYGALIVGFMILEPRGMFGLWVRVRNYLRAWPFRQ